MKKLLIIATAALILGCRHRGDSGNPNLITQDEMLTRNAADIAKLTLGMDKAQVIAVMGSFQAEANDGNIPNPFRSEVLMDGANSYEILRYWTSNPPPFVHIRDRDTTPVVLKNGKVVGWGEAAVNGILPRP